MVEKIEESRIKKWKLLKQEVAFSSDFISVYKESLKRPDNHIVDDYFSVKRRDAVFIIALTKTGFSPNSLDARATQ